MRRSTALALVYGALVLTSCKKGEDPPAARESPAATGASGTATAGAPAPEPAKPAAPAAAVPDVGVAAGGIQRDADEGAVAVVQSAEGTVEVRRVGEAEWKAAPAKTSLYAGDVIRTSDQSAATLALADESVVEVAEVSSVAIGSRLGTADPASSAAVLAGLARFTVASRAPGEGPFRVYTPAGVIVTKGTVYGVGVAASGEARVGVESGAVDVIGLAAVDAAPIGVEGGSVVSLAAAGTVGAPAPWPSDDWGPWRDEADARLEIGAAIDAHGTALADLDGSLRAAYADLDATATSVAQFETAAAASADAQDPAAYQAQLPEGAATIDASFAVAGRAEALTWAYAGRAALAHDLYVRHPAPLEARWTVLGPRVDAAVLWPKRFEVTATGYLEPLRVQYYVHHPRGRVHAPLVGVVVPEFYASVEPPAIEPPQIRARVKTPVWVAPPIQYEPSPRPVWIAAPSVDWSARLAVHAAPPRAQVGWYVRPPTLKANVLVGAPPSARYVARLQVAAPAPRASIRAGWRVPVGMKIRVGAPDLAAGARARVGFRVAGGVGVAGGPVGAVKMKVRPPAIKTAVGVRVPEVRGRASVRAGGNLGAAVKMKVKAPQVKVKVKAPTVKVKAKAGFKVGF